MVKAMPMLAVVILGLALTAGTANASVPRPAPAPLLAAGFPAFVALGGAAWVGRIVRRRKKPAQDNG
jgi:hypothetical protein